MLNQTTSVDSQLRGGGGARPNLNTSKDSQPMVSCRLVSDPKPLGLKISEL